MDAPNPPLVEEPDHSEPVETFLAFAFGDTIQMRTFEDDDEEMQYLTQHGCYGQPVGCPVCGGRTPFVISAAGAADEWVWRGTCMDCWAQIRIPATHDGNGEHWTLHDDDMTTVVLDPVQEYHEREVDLTEPMDHDSEPTPDSQELPDE